VRRDRLHPAQREGRPPLDLYNPDPALRTRPLAGVQILSGLTRSGEEWRNGRIYNPEDGKSYDARLELREDGRLAVKGCVAMLCRTQLWRRSE